MPRGGSKPGERRGGRKKGSLSEATIERALKAERELVNANHLEDLPEFYAQTSLFTDGGEG